MKKCNASCSKPAVYHVTILHEGEVRELHFCETHFHEYMSRPDDLDDDDSNATFEADIFSGIPIQQESEEAEELQCPHCGITFSEFRKEGRFGCPQDYDIFRDKLTPLFENIHNATEHQGKIPEHAFEEGENHLLLIKLKRELNTAVEKEDYEAAAKLRDEIANLNSDEPSATASSESDEG